MKTSRNWSFGFASASAIALIAASAAYADQVINDDLIVTQSLCVGNDCVNGESFGFDTIRMKENNLRLAFIDTSNSGSFPTADWRIVANDSSNGGDNYLAFEDSDFGRQTFKVQQGAPANALLVRSNGNIGLSTANPLVQLHIVDGNSPTLRLEQDGSSGFTPQTFDVAANEANFFVRDVTNGSRLPFKIIPNSPEESIAVRNAAVVINDKAANQDFRVEGVSDDGLFFVDASLGRVAIGVPNKQPLSKLDVRDNTGSGPEQMLRLVNNGAPQLFMRNSSSNKDWMFSAGADMLLGPSDNPANAVFTLASNGNLTINGSLTELSDKNAKMAIEPINAGEILAKVSALPVSSWVYKHDAETGVRHIGPMAQDFYAAFGTGHTDKGISTLDSTGVALAAIQALNTENLALRARVDALEQRVVAE